MSSKPLGGRGCTAPYYVKPIKIPEPIANQVKFLRQKYWDYLEKGGDPFNPPNLVDQNLSVMATVVDERARLLEKRESVINQKTSEDLESSSLKTEKKELLDEINRLNRELSKANHTIQKLLHIIEQFFKKVDFLVNRQ